MENKTKEAVLPWVYGKIIKLYSPGCKENNKQKKLYQRNTASLDCYFPYTHGNTAPFVCYFPYTQDNTASFVCYCPYTQGVWKITEK
jgi:hypothetical protein